MTPTQPTQAQKTRDGVAHHWLKEALSMLFKQQILNYLWLDPTVPIVQVCNVLLRLQAEAQKQLTMKMEAMFQERLWGISFPALERCQFKFWGQYLLRVAKMHHLKSMPYIIHINYRCIACTHTHIYIWHICIYSSVCSYTVRTRTHTHTHSHIYIYIQTNMYMPQ